MILIGDLKEVLTNAKTISDLKIINKTNYFDF